MAVLKSVFLTVSSIAFTGFSASAQIKQDILQPANTYDAGVLKPGTGGLGPDLWQGTTADRATRLINNANYAANASARDLIRAVVLSGGVPPRAQDGLSREYYIAARLNAVLSLPNLDAFNHIVQRSSLNMTSPSMIKLGVEYALLSGDVGNTCLVADNVTIERKAPYWAKLRSYCHFTRNEIPAAELTADLLQRAEHEDDIFYALLGFLTGSQVKFPKTDDIQTALHISMAKQAIKTKGFKTPNPETLKSYPVILAAALAQDEMQIPEVRLAALIQGIGALSTDNLSQILSQFSDTPLTDNADLPKEDWQAKHWGQALNTLRGNTDTAITANLIAAMLSQADARSIFAPISKLIAPEISILSPAQQAQKKPELFARLAVQNRDLSALGGLYLELPDDNPLKARIALASDALGSGFMLGDLGIDIETRLQLSGDKKARAVRDAYLAYGLGARLSDQAIDILQNAKSLNGHVANPGALLALQDASKRRAQAETVFRAAEILGEHSPSQLRADSLAAVFSALNNVSLGHISGQLAAYDFLKTPE